MKSLATAAALGLAALVLAGCSYVNPIVTQKSYAASDGAQLVVDEFDAVHLMVVTSGQGEPAALVGTLFNSSSEDIDIEISFDAMTATQLTVPARSSVQLSPVDGVEVLGTSPVLPGLLAQVGFASGGTGFYQVQAPVMDATLPEYRELVASLG